MTKIMNILNTCTASQWYVGFIKHYKFFVKTDIQSLQSVFTFHYDLYVIF